ncbi:MAG TPA: cob(I)yrinic acid a,c-diamide adenosyltransferase [Ignavibacteriaceae bacterium]|nr:cob(I)yrinic acid a,c-diamide adenosyltransferase [Ignavibacteriaceae bacterium]
MKIYTKTGDNGETSLFGGERVGKNNIRIKAYGSLDELNSFIGLTLAKVKNEKIQEVLFNLQNKLFIVGSDLATPSSEKNKKLNIQRTSPEYITEVENWIDEFSSNLDDLKNFILPGGSEGAALLHICRTIARRAEREIVELKRTEQINENVIIFTNRISDLFFVLSRYENKHSNIPDIKWVP